MYTCTMTESCLPASPRKGRPALRSAPPARAHRSLAASSRTPHWRDAYDMDVNDADDVAANLGKLNVGSAEG